jgi:two-component system copper resistance phosphate regulon response regulator CusR
VNASSLSCDLQDDKLYSTDMQILEKQAQKILIIEDELKTSQYLKQGLEEQGYFVETCNEGNLGLRHALDLYFDLIILDVMLPGLDGWTIMKELRKNRTESFVLFLTARDNLDDRVHGLDLGADAYLVKPFAFTELTALIRSLFRRGEYQGAQHSIQIHDLSIDRVNHVATRASVRLDLTPKEFSLLLLLATHRGETMSRLDISKQIWNIGFDSGTNTVEVHIRRLRAKVDDQWDQKIIKTVRGTGYTID